MPPSRPRSPTPAPCSLAALAALAALAVACQTPVPPAAPVEQVPGAPYPDFDRVYDTTRVATYRLTLTADGWQRLHDEPFEYVEGRFETDGEVHDPVGIRLKGNVSYDYAGEKVSFKVKFDHVDPDGTFHGVDKINLHNGFKDPTIMRENLAYPLYGHGGGPASLTSHVRVQLTVPGALDDEYMGLYIHTEPPSKTYLARELGDDGGTLYKGGDFRWYGDDADEYVPWVYEPRTNEDGADVEALVHFLDVLNNTPDDQLEAALPEVFRVDLFLDWLAANTLLANLDGLPGGGGNCYLYHDTRDGRFVLIPWDMNESFGSTSEGMDLDELLTLDIHHPLPWWGEQPLIERVLAVDAFAADYERRLAELVDGPFAEDTMQGYIDAIDALIREHVFEDDKRHYDDEQYVTALDDDVPGLPVPPYDPDNQVIGLMRFVRERGASVRQQLAR